MKLLLVWFCKFFSWISRTFNIGAGETWPGEIAQRIIPNILSIFLSGCENRVVLVAGTNGKTTTVALLASILKTDRNFRIVVNKSGANLINGLVSTLILNSDFWGNVKADFFIFEVDEMVLSLVLQQISPRAVILMNLFRDQLDRYGEVDLVADKWKEALKKSGYGNLLILNGDDPIIVFIGKNIKGRKKYFGLSNKANFLTAVPFACDSIYCPSCAVRLNYLGYFLSHQGIWGCDECGFNRPKLDISESDWKANLEGVYSKYNILAAVLTAKELGVDDKNIKKALANFKPAFGRQEMVNYKGRKIKLYLSKNPTGFNESIRTVAKKDKNVVLLVLNDRIPDGRDVSWIWDVDVEGLVKRFKTIIVSGDRGYDMGLRIKYCFEQKGAEKKKLLVEKDLKRAINMGVAETKKDEVFNILPTYSAMLEVRKILTGKKIL